MKLEPINDFTLELEPAPAGSSEFLSFLNRRDGTVRFKGQPTALIVSPARRLLQQFKFQNGYLLFILKQGDRAFFDDNLWDLPTIFSLFVPSLNWPNVGDAIQVEILHLSKNLQLVDCVRIDQSWLVRLPEESNEPENMREEYVSAKVFQTSQMQAQLEFWRCARFSVSVGAPRRLPNLIKRLRSWLSFGADDYHGIQHVAGDGSIRVRFVGRSRGPKYKDPQFNWHNVNQILGHKAAAP